MCEYWRVAVFIKANQKPIKKSGIELRPVAHYFGILARKEMPDTDSGKRRFFYKALFPLLDSEVPDDLGVLTSETDIASVHLVAAQFEKKWQEVFGTDQIVELELSRLN